MADAFEICLKNPLRVGKDAKKRQILRFCEFISDGSFGPKIGPILKSARNIGPIFGPIFGAKGLKNLSIPFRVLFATESGVASLARALPRAPATSPETPWSP